MKYTASKYAVNAEKKLNLNRYFAFKLKPLKDKKSK
jgi:hypothetical protein